MTPPTLSEGCLIILSPKPPTLPVDVGEWSVLLLGHFLKTV
jgi:hypothetical protein